MSKTPKWLEKWRELTGDNEFLEIKGWYDWQEKHYTTDYVRDYYGKDEDPDYYTLLVSRRWMMDWLRRQRGRLRHTLPNDPVALIRRMNLHPDDARQAGLNLLSLVACTCLKPHLTCACRFLIPTNQQVRDQKWVNKTKVNEKKETKQDNVVDLPVQSNKTEEQTRLAPPAAKTDECPHNHPHGRQFCLKCNPPATIGGPAPKKPVQSAAPRPKKQLGFDLCSIEPWDDWTAEEIQLVSCYWWEHAEDKWFRDHVNTPEYFRKKFPDMAQRFPKNWRPPAAAPIKLKGRADCERCKGEGTYTIDKVGYPPGMFLDWVPCPCTQEAAHG